ncbi:MAG: hypothetical protein ACK46X_13750 [Candidatus Sericytochromatia bacterium]
MVSFNSQVPNPYQGYFPAPGANPAPAPVTTAPAPAPSQPPAYRPDKGLSPQAALDLVRIVKHPIQTVKSLYLCTRDLLSLTTKRNLSIASAEPVMGQYEAARQNLENAPFRHVLPFFDRALDKWADARFTELKPQVQARVSERAWHPVTLEWPDGGSGHDRLTELNMLRRTAETATDGQIVRALQGANRLQVRNSTALDYFYPLARSGDALILRRNLPLVPGQKPMELSFKGLLDQSVQVNIQIQ